MAIKHPEKIVPRKSDAVIGPGHTYGSITDKISSIVLTRKTPLAWFIAFGISFSLLMVFLFSTTYLLVKGVGIGGIN